MIPLDSSHPFDWSGFEEGTERGITEFLATIGGPAIPLMKRNVRGIEVDLANFGRQLPLSARMLFELDLRGVGQRSGIAPVDVEEAVALRQSFQSVPGLARLLGEAFVPIFYIGDGVTSCVYAPKQDEACADSFVVLVDQIPAGFEYAAFSVGVLLGLLSAIVYSVEKGHPERLGSKVPPLMREWLL